MKSPIVLILYLYLSTICGVLYLLPTTVSEIFVSQYGFSQRVSGHIIVYFSLVTPIVGLAPLEFGMIGCFYPFNKSSHQQLRTMYPVCDRSINCFTVTLSYGRISSARGARDVCIARSRPRGTICRRSSVWCSFRYAFSYISMESCFTKSSLLIYR